MIENDELSLAWEAVKLPPDWRDESKQPRCSWCGRFASKAKSTEGKFSHWYLNCLNYDYWTNSYDHD